jgi:hypothetical protein
VIPPAPPHARAGTPALAVPVKAENGSLNQYLIMA